MAPLTHWRLIALSHLLDMSVAPLRQNQIAAQLKSDYIIYSLNNCRLSKIFANVPDFMYGHYKKPPPQEN